MLINHKNEMNITEKSALWYRFITKHYGSMTYTGALQHASIIETDKGCEIRIPVVNAKIEEALNKSAVYFESILGEPGSEFASLLPVSFTLLRTDGTLIPVVSKPYPRLPDGMFLTREERIRNEEEEFRNRLNEQMSTFSCNLSNMVKYADNPPEDVKKCKKDFMLILEEIEKVGEDDRSFKRADRFISSVKVPLDIIEKEISAYSDYFKYAYNVIVNKYLDVVFESSKVNPSLSGIRIAINRVEQFDSIALTELTCARLKQAKVLLQQLYQSPTYKRNAKETERASRMSEKIKEFALSHWYIRSGGKRYTASGLGLLALIVYAFGWIVSLFESFFSLFKKANDA